MTEPLFREDAYLRSSLSTVTATMDGGMLVLDRTIFYPRGGGQPGDTGVIETAEGRRLTIVDTVYAPDRSAILHRIGESGAAPVPVGSRVELHLDWAKRFNRMRIHTALHLLTAVLPFPVTGGAIGDGEGRLDFDMPSDGLDRSEVEERLNALIAKNAAVTTTWITDAELAADPGLVKTLSVKPPVGTGRVRLVKIGDIDLQPCGGTHVRITGEIGRVAVTGIERKGKQNRRVRIGLDSSPDLG